MLSNKSLIRCAGVLAALLCGGLVMAQALGQSDAWGAAGGPPSLAKPQVAVPPAGLNDMLQPVDDHAAAAAPWGPAPSLDELTAEPGPRVSLPDRLRAWPDSTRREAQLQVELPRSAPDAVIALAREVEASWSAGQHDAAITLLQRLEDCGTPVAVGVAWSTPQTVGGEIRGYTDVRIGTRAGGDLTKLDYDQTSGALFAVVRSSSDNGWGLYRSTTDGRSWAETYFWWAGAGEQAVDVDMVVVGNYVYVGYVPSDVANEARLRRSFASTGASDIDYGYQVVLNSTPSTITELEVESNADSLQNRIYYAVRQSNNVVRWAWDESTDGTTFIEDSPAGAAAVGGLDLCWNPGYATYFNFLSYIGTDGLVHVLRKSAGSWSAATTTTFDGTHNRTAISAWDDHVICAHELQMTNGQGIRYFISHDGGGTWDYFNYVAEPRAGEGPYQMADVTARGAAGTAIVYTHEVGEPDDVLIRYRRNYAPGLWQDPLRVNNNDVSTGSWTALNWTPRDTSDGFELSYGLIYLSGGLPYFNRLQVIRGDMNCDGTYGYLSFGDINPFVLYVSNNSAWRAAYPDCPPENGDINGNGTYGQNSFGDINPFVALLSNP
jgi:hypothetical protein